MTDSNCEQISSQDYEKMTPLHHAVFHKREKFAMTLIKVAPKYSKEYRDQLNAQDVRGMTPLHLSAIHSSLIIVTSLLNAGADPHIKNLSGDTALDLAKTHKRKDIASELEYYT